MEAGDSAAMLEERDQKISRLRAELGERDVKLKERDRKITKMAAEIRRLTALLGERESSLRKLTSDLAKCDATIRIFTAELGEQLSRIGELSADVGACKRQLRQREEELEAREETIREKEAEIRTLRELLQKLEEQEEPVDLELPSSPSPDDDPEVPDRSPSPQDTSPSPSDRSPSPSDTSPSPSDRSPSPSATSGEEPDEIAEGTAVLLDPSTAHPRLRVSPDLRSVRWEFTPEPTPGPPSGTPLAFDTSPCVLGHPTFTSGQHSWLVDLREGQFCALGVCRDSLGRSGAFSPSPAEGVWALQLWGYQTRALTAPPTPLHPPRVPRKVRVDLDLQKGVVAFGDEETRAPLFAFSPGDFGEGLRPWFWLELGAMALGP